MSDSDYAGVASANSISGSFSTETQGGADFSADLAARRVNAIVEIALNNLPEGALDAKALETFRKSLIAQLMEREAHDLFKDMAHPRYDR